MKRNRKSASFFLVAIIAVQVLLLLITAWRTGPGWDEWGHLPSGLFSLQYGDWHPYRVNPPLVRLVSAIPVAILGGGIEFAVLPKAPGFRSEGYLGMAYINQQGPDVFFWVSIARTAVIPIAIFGTVLIYRVATHFGGRLVGQFAAVLWSFSPTVLAFGGSITPDVAAAVFGFWATWCFYAWLRIGRNQDAIWLGLSIAAAMLSKSTWIILPPILLVMMLILTFSSRPKMPQRHRWLQFSLAAGIAWVLIHATYDFQGLLRPLSSFDFISETLSGNDNSSMAASPIPGNRFTNTPLSWIPAPLPAAYIEGIDVQKRDFELRDMRSYLMGTWSERGWWYYYAIAWLLKEPLAFWLSVTIGWGFASRSPSHFPAVKRLGLYVVLCPGLLVFLVVSSQTGFNHHLRYVLPAFPAMFLVASLPIARVGLPVRRTLIAFGFWFAISSVSMVPRSYAYFSEAVGGWRNGHRYLNASNLDWGQDLLAIRQWARENPENRPIHLLYSPSQLDFKRLGIDATIAEGHVSKAGPTADGWWVVSIDRLLTEPNSWFLEQTPSERISVSTTVFRVEDGKVVNPDFNAR